MPEFRVSIVIPVFNRADLLREVLSGLSEQTCGVDLFVVQVCDDGSVENLSEVVADFMSLIPNLSFLRQDNQGPAAARNLGTRASNSEYVIYLDSDVLPDPFLVESLMNAMDDHRDWVGAEATVTPVDGEDNVLWDAPKCDRGGVFLTAAIIYRLAILQKIGGFDQTFLRAACEDVELAVRAMKFGQIGYVPEAVVLHPRRRRNAGFFWTKRADWRYTTMLAIRHGFIGWPENVTRHPRLRLTAAALVTLPLGRMIEGLKMFKKSPSNGFEAMWHAFVCWLAGGLGFV